MDPCWMGPGAGPSAGAGPSVGATGTAPSGGITRYLSKKGHLRCHMRRGRTGAAQPGEQMAGGAELPFPGGERLPGHGTVPGGSGQTGAGVGRRGPWRGEALLLGNPLLCCFVAPERLFALAQG